MRWGRRIAAWVRQLLLFVEEPAALWALAAWPKFSLTSYRMLAELRRQGIRPASIIDVGANVGQFAVAARKIYPVARIVAFEPNHGVFQQLQRNLGGMTGIEARCTALGKHTGTLAFRVNADSRSSSFLSLGSIHLDAFPHAREVGVEDVAVSTLDLELGETQLADPCLLKLDVQGYESAVLEGARETLKRVQFVILETSFSPVYEGELPFAEVLKLMSGMGFDLIRPIAFLTHPGTGEILQMDALFGRRR